MIKLILKIHERFDICTTNLLILLNEDFFGAENFNTCHIMFIQLNNLGALCTRLSADTSKVLEKHRKMYKKTK